MPRLRKWLAENIRPPNAEGKQQPEKTQTPKHDALQVAWRDARQKSLHALEDIHTRILESEDVEFDEDTLISLGITCEDFTLRTDGTSMPYFEPWSLEQLANHEIDFTEEITEEHHSTLEECMSELGDNSRQDQMQGADMVASYLDHVFSAFERVADNTESANLRELSGWKTCRNKREVLLESLGDPYLFVNPQRKTYRSPAISRFEGAWVRDDGTPHANVLMSQNHIPPSNQLLRTELLTIIGVMITRLKIRSLTEHKNFPVLLVSSMNALKARVLQAHYSSSGLVVYKSRLYSFATKDARDKNLALIALYMASQPAGDTRVQRRVPELSGPLLR